MKTLFFASTRGVPAQPFESGVFSLINAAVELLFARIFFRSMLSAEHTKNSAKMTSIPPSPWPSVTVLPLKNQLSVTAAGTCIGQNAVTTLLGRYLLATVIKP